MRVRIHRGAREVGGNCVELESGGRRLLLDLGLPLGDAVDPAAAVPPVEGLTRDGDGSLLAVVISHPHLDHYGLLPFARPGLPVYIGKPAADMIAAAAPFVRRPAAPFVGRPDAPFARPPAAPTPAGFLEDGRSFALGPFRVTPFRADHSAFGGFSLVVEADGRTLIYTGDVRAHGRTAAFRDFLARAPRRADALIVEGTSLTPNAPLDGVPCGERALERRIGDAIGRGPGVALLAFSPQNVDRWVTAYRAATIAARRVFVTDVYGEAIARAVGRAGVPHAGHSNYRIFVPDAQRRQAAALGVDAAARVSADEIAAAPRRFALLFRPGVVAALERRGLLRGATLVWSQWRGYLEDGRGAATLELIARHGMRREDLHTSGHAAPRDLRRLAETLMPKSLVPIHTAAPERFRELYDAVDPRPDGEWWAA